jgi:hypothetical protein
MPFKRRRFSAFLALAAVCVSLGGSLGLVACQVPDQPLTPVLGLSSTAQRARQQILQAQGVKVSAFTPDVPAFTWWMALGGKAYALENPELLNNLLSQGFFTRELAKYPPRFFTQAPIPELLFAAKTAGGVLAGGGVSQGFSVNAFNRRLAVLSLDPAVYQVQDLNVTLHHEIFHLIDDQPNDPRWLACHQGEMPYAGAKEAPEATLYPAKGFVSDYARTDMREDRAELFSWMMASPELSQALSAYAQQDAVLACKKQLLEAYLVQHFPNFDAAQLYKVRWGNPVVAADGHVRELVVTEPPPALQTTPLAPLPDAPFPLPVEVLTRYGRLHDFASDVSYTAVPESLEAWEELERFELTRHRLREVPEVISRWHHLKLLTLRGTPLKAIPKHLEALTYLRRLDVDLAGPIQANFSDQAYFSTLVLRLAPELTQLPEGLEQQQFLPTLTLTGPGLQSILPLRRLLNLRQLTLGALPAWRERTDELTQLGTALKKLELLTLAADSWSDSERQQLRQQLPERVRLEFTPEVLVGDLMVE